MEWSLLAECLEPRFIFLVIIQRLANITRKLHQSEIEDISMEIGVVSEIAMTPAFEGKIARGS